MRARLSLVAIGGIALLVVIIGVGAVLARSPDQSPAQPSSRSAATHDSVAGAGAPVPPYVIPPDDLPRWLEVVSDPVRPAIEDGVFTFEEYEALVFVTVRCIEEAGMQVVHSTGYGRAGGAEPGPRLSRRGVYTYHAIVTTYSPTPPAREIRLLEACKSLTAGIQELWAQHTAPTLEEIQEMRDYMAQCLRDGGVSVAEHPSDQDLRRLLDAGVSPSTYQQCQFATADAFETDSPPG